MLEFYEPQQDFGTPISTSEQMVTPTTDGKQVTVPEGTSIMCAAAESGVKVLACRYRPAKVLWLLPCLLGRDRGRRGFGLLYDISRGGPEFAPNPLK